MKIEVSCNMKLRNIYIICKDSYEYNNKYLKEFGERYSAEMLSNDKLQQLINIEFLFDEVNELLNKEISSTIDM